MARTSQHLPCDDGSGEIPFAYVNDGYDDCNDGSDESTVGLQAVFFNRRHRSASHATVKTTTAPNGTTVGTKWSLK